MNFNLSLILSFIISILLVVIIMPFYIKSLKAHEIAQTVSEYALDEYKNKAKTPIMGGLVFVIATLITYLIVYAKGYTDKTILFVILSVFLFGLVGAIDDILIITRHNNEGLSPKTKLIMEFIFVLILFFIFKDILNSYIDLPFTGSSIYLPLIIYLPFIVLLYGAEANAVNFTDGMDGLCAGVSAIALIPFAIFAYKNQNLALVIFIVCFIGALIGYLFFNFHPAKIFMGDSGSLALGALFASLAIVLNKEIALFFVGGVFAFEMFCVCLQLTSVKLFKKRVFKYTPIHYAFVIKGKKEVNVVLMFYLLAIILGIIGLIIGLN